MINVHEAKTTLSALLARVEQGEEIVIARNGEPIARLTPIVRERARVPGGWRTWPGWADFRYDATVFAPLNQAEAEAEGWL